MTAPLIFLLPENGNLFIKVFGQFFVHTTVHAKAADPVAMANAFREARDAIEAQSAAREVNEIEQRRVAALTRSWELAKLRYTNGIASQLDVIDAERNLLLAELNRIEAERGFRAAIADFYKATGGRVQ